MSVPTLPAHLKTVLITGAGGFVGDRLTTYLLENYPDLKLILTDIRAPRERAGGKTVSLAADLGKPGDVAALFAQGRVDGVFALHGIMSGGSEADFEFGYRVNVDSHRALLEATRQHGKQYPDAPKVLYVNTSSLAVYGGPKATPDSHVDPESTPLNPETSYGTAKAITELFVFDYSRKGFLDGRTVRLPTVCVRAGAPSSAASSFISGLIREPLMGKESEVPITNDPSDPILSSMKIWVGSTKGVIRNIAHAMTVPAEKYPVHHRSVNIPGVTITTRTILDALEKYGGKEAIALVKYKYDAVVTRICKSWAGSFDNSFALSLGFAEDYGFDAAVEEFKSELK